MLLEINSMKLKVIRVIGGFCSHLNKYKEMFMYSNHKERGRQSKELDDLYNLNTTFIR